MVVGAAAQEAEPQEGPPPAEEPSTTPAVGRLYIATIALFSTKDSEYKVSPELKNYFCGSHVIQFCVGHRVICGPKFRWVIRFPPPRIFSRIGFCNLL